MHCKPPTSKLPTSIASPLMHSETAVDGVVEVPVLRVGKDKLLSRVHSGPRRLYSEDP
jgi:hypothetical protein